MGDWYDALVTDCRAIVTERLYRSRMELIEAWHEVGQRIATDENYQRNARGNGDIRERLAGDIGTSVKTLYRAIQFYEKYPELSQACETFEEGKNISWTKITQKYLPDVESTDQPDNTEHLCHVLYSTAVQLKDKTHGRQAEVIAAVMRYFVPR